MPTSLILVRFVRHALIAASGSNTPDRAQLGAGFDVLCAALQRRLHPFFGSAAIDALFARALHMAVTEFPWLGDVVPEDHDRCSIDGLERASGELDPRLMADGLAAILAHEIALLIAFVGDDIVMPLVQEAWADTSPTETGGPERGRP